VVYLVSTTEVWLWFMCKIAYYFLILIKFIPTWYWHFPLDLQYVFQILARLKHAYVSYSNFAKCAKRRKNKEIFFKSYLRNGWRNFLQIWNMALPWVEGTSVVNLVLFRSDIMELHMCKNCSFVLPVNMLTLFGCVLFSWATWHTSMCLDACFPTWLQRLLYRTINFALSMYYTDGQHH